MPARRIALILAAILVVAGCGNHAGPRFSIETHHPVRPVTTARLACVSQDCGPYAATIHWAGISIPSQTGYYVYKDAEQVADVATATYTFHGIDCGTTFSIGVRAHNGTGGTSSLYTTSYTSPSCSSSPTFPLSVSSGGANSGRYLQTASNQPFLMVGDSPQSLIGNISCGTIQGNGQCQAGSAISNYLANRVAHGFNTLWINLLCTTYTYCNANGSTNDGTNLTPFTTGTEPATSGSDANGYDLSTPRATYFARAHAIVATAQADGLEVVLDPIEAGGWIYSIDQNGNGNASQSGTCPGTGSKDYCYGRYLGTTFGDLQNIIWMSGNDFWGANPPPTTESNNALAVAEGIQATDSTALQTVEFNFQFSSSLDVSAWSAVANLNASYTYGATYYENLHAYNQTPTLPMFMVEANYENEQNPPADGGYVPRYLRSQEYWTMLSGATGQLYGNYYTVRTTASSAGANWASSANIDTTGVTQLGYVTSLFSGRSWWKLVPDQQAHGAGSLVTAGYGTYANAEPFASNDYVQSAVTSDGTLGMAYIPTGGASRTITVDMTKMAGTTTAQWYDPTTGNYAAVNGSPFSNTGTRTFTPTGNNAGGDGDWVLVLTASGGGGSAPAVTAEPQILTPTRAPIVGQTLPTANGTWSGTVTGYTYQWQRCTELDKNCADIGGATGNYTLTSSDVGKNVRLITTACNGAACNSATSNWTPAITADSSTCTTTLNPPTGADNSPYPGAAIQTALTNAAAGDVVCLNAGDYHDGQNGQANDGIDLYFENPATPVILQPTPGAVVNIGSLNMNGVNNLVVRGFNMDGAVVLNGSSGDTFAGNTISGAFNGDSITGNAGNNQGFYFYGNGSSQSNMTVQGNQMDRMEGANGAAGSTGNSQCITAIGVATISFSHNVCGPYVRAHLTQYSGGSNITQDYNTFLGPSPYSLPLACLPEDPTPCSTYDSSGYHNNVMQIFGGGTVTGIDFSNNYMWHTQSRAQSLLWQEAAFANATIDNNLTVEDPACRASLDCPGYVYGLCGATGYLTMTNNTIVDSAWGNLVTHSQNDEIGNCITPNTGQNYTVTHNIWVAPDGQASGGFTEFNYAECASGCTFDYNASDDSSASQGSSTHFQTGWSAAWGDGSSTSYAFPGQWYQDPTGLSFSAGYQH